MKKEAEEVASNWEKEGETARKVGTDVHELIDLFYKTGERHSTCREFRLFLQFHSMVEKLGYIPFASEKKVFHQDLLLAGRVDMLYMHKDQKDAPKKKLWLVDWKRCKSIHTTGYNDRTGLPPLDGLPDCNYQHYTMQLNVYKYLLKNIHGYEVNMMSLVVLHPEQTVYSLYHVPDRQDLVHKMLYS